MRVATLALLLCLLPARPTLAQGTAAPVGAEVRIELMDGTRAKGRLVSLNNAEVVLRRHPQAPEITHRLAGVRRVETVHHNRRNFALAGLGIGVAVALLGNWCGTGAYGSSNEPECFTAMPALVTAGGALSGAAIGQALDSKRRKILFIGPARSASRSPSSRSVVLGAGIRW